MFTAGADLGFFPLLYPLYPRLATRLLCKHRSQSGWRKYCDQVRETELKAGIRIAGAMNLYHQVEECDWSAWG